MVSPLRRTEIISALRRGTVPHVGLDTFAVGLDRFRTTLLEELREVRRGHGGFKAVRGEYGSGKTFFSRWVLELARREGFATAEVQISETETPLHRLETVYRRLTERLMTADGTEGALRTIIDGWFYTLEEDVLGEGSIEPQDAPGLIGRSQALMEKRLSAVTQSAPAFASVLRAYRTAALEAHHATAEGLISWLGGQPNVGASIKRAAGIKGEIDHFAAGSFLAGLMIVLRDSGYPGLVLVLDEVETLQRVRGDTRDKGLNALRQLIDEVDGGRFPGLYLMITGTPAFFDGPQGVQRLPPLAQRLNVDFATDARFDNPRAPQVRLPGFDRTLLEAVGRRIRDLFADGADEPERIKSTVDDTYIETLAQAVAGRFGGRVGVAPRLFLKKLVADVLDRVDQFRDFDPRRDYALTVTETELTAVERRASAATDIDDIELDP